MLICCKIDEISLYDSGSLKFKGILQGNGQSFQPIYIEKYNFIAAGYNSGAIIVHNLTLGNEFASVLNKMEHVVIRVDFDEKRDLLYANLKPAKIKSWKLDIEAKGLIPIREINFPFYYLSFLMPVNNGLTLLL